MHIILKIHLLFWVRLKQNQPDYIARSDFYAKFTLITYNTGVERTVFEYNVLTTFIACHIAFQINCIYTYVLHVLLYTR